MKKNLDFEINILPTLDILSVLICFLLITAVWIQVGTIDTKQALGDNSASGAQNPPSLWVTVSNEGDLRLSLRDLKSRIAWTETDAVLNTRRGEIPWDLFNERIQRLKGMVPDLKTVVIRPEARTDYGDVIQLMDNLKKNQLLDVGISPLG